MVRLIDMTIAVHCGYIAMNQQFLTLLHSEQSQLLRVLVVVYPFTLKREFLSNKLLFVGYGGMGDYGGGMY